MTIYSNAWVEQDFYAKPGIASTDKKGGSYLTCDNWAPGYYPPVGKSVVQGSCNLTQGTFTNSGSTWNDINTQYSPIMSWNSASGFWDGAQLVSGRDGDPISDNNKDPFEVADCGWTRAGILYKQNCRRLSSSEWSNDDDGGFWTTMLRSKVGLFYRAW